MKIKINKLNYKIIEVDAKDERLKNSENYSLGVCSYLHQEIYLSNALSKEVKRATLIHELTHAFICACGLLYVDEWNHETVCEFTSYTNEEIYKITQKYFKKEMI